MDYRDAVLKANEMVRKDGSVWIHEIADALMAAYNEGCSKPYMEKPATLESAEAYCRNNDLAMVKNGQWVLTDAEYKDYEEWVAAGRPHRQHILTRDQVKDLMADRARMDWLDSNIDSPTRQHIGLTSLYNFRAAVDEVMGVDRH